jgi:hypothetical protein
MAALVESQILPDYARMPTEARNRAERCRARAQECLQLANSATDQTVKDHYQQIAQNYLEVANAEEMLAERLEKSGLI